MALPLVWATTGWDRAQSAFDEEGKKIVALVAPLDRESLERRVLVTGVFGIEDNSRYWSVAMALEHLIVAGDMLADLLVELTHGRDVPRVLAIKDVKPTGELDGSTLPAAFAAFLERYRAKAATPTGDRSAPGRFKHPWFGPLTAHQRQCFAPMHQRIHRRQIEAILYFRAVGGGVAGRAQPQVQR